MIKIDDICVGDVLQSSLYEHRVRILSPPRFLYECWVCSVIHVTGENEGCVVNSYHVTNTDIPESSMVFVNSNFTPIKNLTKLKF